MDGEEVRWLGPAEMRAWLSYLAGSTLLEGALDRQLQRDSGMPHAYYQILVILESAPDQTLRMSDLANLLHSSQSRISHAVNKLERNGWVCRRPCPDDRRGTLATLTGAGRDALAAAAPGHVRIVREALFDRLTPEQVDQLAEIWGCVLDGLQPGRSGAISLPDAVRRGIDATG